MTCHFIPPYLLRRLTAQTADQRVIDCGELTLRVDEQLRARREAPPKVFRSVRAADESKRVIHSAANTEDLPGVVARGDHDPATGDPAVDEAHASAGQVWDVFADHFGRSSVDGSGQAISVTVHYGQDYDNAFWDGTQLVFGDGDGEIFERFTKPMDVMAHEFTHGVTQFTAGLAYVGQSGALNESVSDAFAAMTKQRALGQTADRADWLIGEGLFRPGVNAKALRSMTDPGSAYDDPRLGRDPQVGSMDAYVDTQEDNGGVHINSGIPNRAFARAALGIGGHSWEAPGRVWYDALTAGEVSAEATFAEFAQATVNSAIRLFADNPAIVEQIRSAWAEVGVPIDQAPVPIVGLASAGPDLTGPDFPSQDFPGPDPADPGPTRSGERVSVRRSGGVAGQVRLGELDLDSEPLGPEVRSLMSRVNLRDLTATTSMPDRFVYTVEYRHYQVTLPEQDLTPELHRVVQIVLGARRDIDLS